LVDLADVESTPSPKPVFFLLDVPSTGDFFGVAIHMLLRSGFNSGAE